ncbi:MAG: LON peptidase substrate-binding domain-containing protein, partial [Planctomycetia bacterium]|nr:LON peptidase substrate-binding domain-containing protein [Planctomycetia bacterium]
MTEVKVHEKSDVSGLFLEDMEMSLPDELGIMAVRNLIVFPGLLQPLTVGRPRSLALVQDAAIGNKLFAIVAQKDGEKEDPKFADLYKVGCAVRILKLIKLPDGTRNVVVQALSRIRMLEEVSHDPFFKARVEQVPDVKTEGTELDALTLSTRQQIVRIIELSPQVPKEASLVVANIEDPGHLADFIATNLNMEMAKRQHFLETADVRQRLSELTDMMRREIDVLELAGKIQSDARANIEKTQREYYLREQLKAIQRELGEEDEKGRLVTELRGKIEAADMPSPVEVEAKRELSRLESMPMQAADFNVARTYLEYLVELPWAKSTVDRLNITEAQRILNNDHYGLKKPKKRIVEFLAVRKLKKDPKGPILCFVGPPGVGKTSLGQSIARAMGRKFVRVSLGGMHDEAEIRGHRRTYVGALPGRIIQELRKLQTNNPVFMLDEIDKLGVDFRGDPTS